MMMVTEEADDKYNFITFSFPLVLMCVEKVISFFSGVWNSGHCEEA